MSALICDIRICKGGVQIRVCANYPGDIDLIFNWPDRAIPVRPDVYFLVLVADLASSSADRRALAHDVIIRLASARLLTLVLHSM